MIRLLTVLLVLQIAAVALLYWPADDGEAPAPSLAAGLPSDSVETIEIRDSEGEELRLQRRDDGWFLSNGLPAMGSMVDTLLTALIAEDPGLAIATSDRAAERFKVADDDYERRLRLSGGGQERVVYLGSSPAFRKIHARRAGERAVYVLEFNSYDAATNDQRWLDRGLLAARDVSALELYGVRYERAEDAWTRADGEAVDDAAMETLLQVLSSLQVSGLVEADDEEAAAAGESLRLDVEGGGARRRLTVLDNPDAERFYLSSDRYDVTFNTSSYDAERLIDAARALAGIEAPAGEGAPGDDEEVADEADLDGEAGAETAGKEAEGEAA
jgi:hypothetical protein